MIAILAFEPLFLTLSLKYPKYQWDSKLESISSLEPDLSIYIDQDSSSNVGALVS